MGLREATRADWPALLALNAASVRELSPLDEERLRCWFGDRYERFLYLDRIAVAASRRRQGIGAQLYDAMEAAAAPFEQMVCDVNIDPPNDASLAFHAFRGYLEVGRLEHGAVKTVSLLGKELEAGATVPARREPSSPSPGSWPSSRTACP